MHCRLIRLIGALTVMAGLVAACGGGSKSGAAKAKEVPTLAPTTEAPTTTAPPAAATSPLTGLPVANPAFLNRVALIVKIDNAPEARPQAGLVEADVVFEEQVEGGISRLMAIYQSADANPVGPVRSARSTDISIASELNHPLFGYSGANALFLKLVRNSPLVDVGVDLQPSVYNRVKGRPAPHNLFSSTSGLYSKAPAGASAPPPLFTYRAPAEPPSGAGIAPATHLQIIFQSRLQVTVYDWNAGTGSWDRTENGTPHVDIAGRRASPKNVIVQIVNYHNTGLVDPSGSPVPEANLIGTGEAWLLSGGTIVKGTWSKPSAGAVTTYADAAGQPWRLAPGSTWVELAPPGTATAS